MDKTTMAEVLRRAVRESGQTLAAINRGSGVPLPRLWLFQTGQQASLSPANASKLASYLHLELRPARRGRR